MSDSTAIPSIEDLKFSAGELRRDIAAEGIVISHGQALERIAHDLGFRDWNTLSAAARDSRPKSPVSKGERVTGHYLGQSFTATVIDSYALEMHSRYRVTLHFDEPVDVVTFESFSSFRQRVTCTLTPDGRTPQKTSNGKPQLVLEGKS
ncbi:glyoxalase superfamily protein [Nisaea acidiphila]|uniref:Glyoxalase superfamily protein n=1 Tax=Nisaea acidiphila TaxID=1862145 RepID=A0A9J7AXR1_9PROT|nr:glyoxalase superfamily protein [Nisaea acidiphila]UUX50205.1 glyoxalase superfamily protein [Nisaea acidiphila]